MWVSCSLPMWIPLILLCKLWKPHIKLICPTEPRTQLFVLSITAKLTRRYEKLRAFHFSVYLLCVCTRCINMYLWMGSTDELLSSSFAHLCIASLHHFLVPFFFRVCPSLCCLSLLQSGAMMAAITTLLEKGGIAAVRMVTWWAAPVWATAKENSNVNLVSADCRTHTRAGCRVRLMIREHVWCE